MIGELEETLNRLANAGPALRRRSHASLVASLVEALESLSNPELALGRQARERLPESSGLSLPMVAWGLWSAFRDLDEACLMEALRRAAPPTGYRSVSLGLASVVLAGNVFTAPLSPFLWSLLCRTPVLFKASRRDDVFPRLLRNAIAQHDEELAEAVGVVTFRGGDEALEARMFSASNAVSVFGSDQTLRSIQRRLDPTTEFVPHGHGLGVGFVARSALSSHERAEAVAEAFSLDVAAYDQRGCMSPHAIFVERGGMVDGQEFSEMLHVAMESRSFELPRGTLSSDEASAQIQWRGVGAVRDGLLEGDGWAVSFERDCAFRISPGFRNILVLEVDNTKAFVSRIRPMGLHLKTIGVGGTAACCDELGALLHPNLSPRLSFAGQMQTPRLWSLADGRLPWLGFRRLVEVDVG